MPQPGRPLRTVFSTADLVGNLTVFNSGGHKGRLIAARHSNRHRVYIRAVLTHQEYDEGKWKEEGMGVTTSAVATVGTHWAEIADTVFVPHTQAEDRRLVALWGVLEE